MEFLRKYYEKIVLGVLLFGFLLALIFLLQKTGAANHVTAQDLKFAAPESKYESTDFKSADFDFESMFAGKNQWQERTADKGESAGADLVVPMKALRCSVCQKIVPYATVKKDLRCPICGEKLENPPDASQMADLERNGRDSDKDGMPDKYETKMGFNPQSPNDASEDADQDGFSNLYEFLIGTNPKNAKSYPSLEKRIYLVRLNKMTYPVKLKGVTVIPDPKDKDSKRLWDISLEIERRSTPVTIGQEVTIAKHRYKVADAVRQTKEELNTSVVLDTDQSRVYLEPLEEGGEKLVLEVGKPVYSSSHRAIIEDIYTGTVYRVSVGDTFTVGEKDATQVTFQVKATDAEKDHVTLINQDTGAEVLLTRDIKIPPEARVGYFKQDRNGMGAGNGGNWNGADTALPPGYSRQQRNRQQRNSGKTPRNRY